MIVKFKHVYGIGLTLQIILHAVVKKAFTVVSVPKQCRRQAMKILRDVPDRDRPVPKPPRDIFSSLHTWKNVKKEDTKHYYCSLSTMTV